MLKRWRLVLVLFAADCLMLGCENTTQVIVEPNPLGDSFEVPASKYSTSFYFIDTSYRALYEPYFLKDPPEVNWSLQVVESEVWISRPGSVPHPEEIPVRADLHLAAYHGNYADSLRVGYDVPGRIETFQGYRLSSKQYELVGDGYLGIIRIDQPISDIHRIGVSYRRADGTQVGEFARNVLDSAFVASERSIVIKLVKPANLFQVGSIYSDAWKLLVKSIYPIGYTGVIKTLFQLDVFQQGGATLGSHSILGRPLLTILALDRYSSDGTPGGNGTFDYIPGRTIDQNNGYIIMPYLRPFDDGIKRYFESIGQPVNDNSAVLIPQLYDTTFAAQGSTTSYVIKGSTLHQ